MKQLSYLLIEDNEADAHQFMHLLAELPLTCEVDWSKTGTDVINYLTTKTYDLIFLDMKMPELTGIDLLRAIAKRPPVIIVTAYIEYAEPCYDLDVVDFLVKPVDHSRLQRAISRTLTSPVSFVDTIPHSSIFLQVGRRRHQFHFKDIRYIEASGAYAKIHEQGITTTVRESISWLALQLPPAQFIRIQKSFIINVTHITAIDARSVWIGPVKMAIGDPYRELVKQFMATRRGKPPGGT